MKANTFLFTLLFSFIFLGCATSKEKGIERNTNQQNVDTSSLGNLLNSKNFEFIANTVFPTTGSPKNLVGSGYSVTFSPEMIISNLPFYGRAYSGMALSRDKGMRFKGKPEDFTVENNNEYQINATVNGENDTYEISMSVGESGFATLAISSNDRGTISYQGEVVQFKN